ncbi:MAG: M23 family metallopeptidase [Chloroflexi bacterium]|nr:M23 family metallopeptidase [Chloroflexota bacterium]MBU1747977.1 M23 family metallopeptidase [Chloroflexota bacterium]
MSTRRTRQAQIWRRLTVGARAARRRVRRLWDQRYNLRREDWLPVASRYGAHALVVTLVLVVTVVSVGLWPEHGLAQTIEPAASQGAAVAAQPSFEAASEPTFLVPLALPKTIIPKRGRRDVVTYIVQKGDVIHSIADKFEVSVGTLMWANPDLEENPDLLIIGQELIILPIDGVYHTVKEGDTIESIAKKYSIEPAAIWDCEFNDQKVLDTLPPGAKIIAPGGKKPYVPRPVYVYSGSVPKNAQRGTGTFGWPTSGVITQGYWVEAGGYGHPAIDIANPSQPWIRAADSGFVIRVERNTGNTGYGNYVMVDHRNGFVTLYAHLDTILVNVGDSVGKGAILGQMGNTGKVRGITGIHLHFEIIRNGVRVNPRIYLR